MAARKALANRTRHVLAGIRYRSVARPIRGGRSIPLAWVS